MWTRYILYQTCRANKEVGVGIDRRELFFLRRYIHLIEADWRKKLVVILQFSGLLQVAAM